jgi:hypothetical protein
MNSGTECNGRGPSRRARVRRTGRWDFTTAHDRRAKFAELCRLGLPMRFPQGVDVALAYQGPMPLAKYIDSEMFVFDCRDYQSRYREVFAVDEWTLDVVRSGKLPNGHLLIDRQCDLLLRRVEKLLPRFYRNQWETDRHEVLAEIRKQVLEAIPRFNAAEVVAGGVRFHRFDGYMHIHVFHRAKERLVDVSRRAELEVQLHGDDGFEAIAATGGLDVGELLDYRQLVDTTAKALADQLGDFRLWQVFRAAVFDEVPVAVAAEAWNIGHTRVWELLDHVQTGVVDAICEQCPEADAVLEQFEWRHFCRLVRAWFVEDDFIARVAAPEAQ